jgi:hypothetical protein
MEQPGAGAGSLADRITHMGAILGARRTAPQTLVSLMPDPVAN